MIAGGLGSIAARQTHKIQFPAGTLLIQLGGPGMRIGMGGGAASSMAAGANTAELDFDSVQRGNPEIQRRAQEVINHCWRARARRTRSSRSTTWAPAASATPSPSWSTARAAARASTCARCRSKRAAWRPRRSGATRARSATCWRSRRSRCRCSQAMCERERCPFAVVGVATEERSSWCSRTAPQAASAPIDMPMDVLLGKPPKMQRDVQRVAARRRQPLDLTGVRSGAGGASTCCATRPWRASAS